MNSTIDPDTLAMLTTSLRHVLADRSSDPIGARLAELGWEDVVAVDPSTALRTLFEVKGHTLSTADALGPALNRTYASAVGEPPGLTDVGLPSPFGASVSHDDRIEVDVILLSPLTTAVLAVGIGGRLAVVDTADLAAAPIGGIDPDLGAVRMTGQATVAAWHEAPVWDAIVARGRWLVSCELVGVARHVIDQAVQYTKQRVQYGKPIGVFQALQHRLASAHALLSGAARLAAEAGDDGDPWTAMIAKSMAGQAAEFACTQAQQCYGAIGFTWEHEFHRYLRRTYALDHLFGDWRTLEHEIGDRLQNDGVVPRIGSL